MAHYYSVFFILADMMKYLRYITLLLLATAFVTPVCAQKLIDLSPADFLAGINAVSNAQIIDLRTPEDYMYKHIPRAVNIEPTSFDFIPDVKDQMCFSDTLFIYCRVGKTKSVAQLLFDNGYNVIYSLKGGSVAWEAYEEKLQRQKRKSPTL